VRTVILTPNKQSNLQWLESQAETIRRDTKVVSLRGGPFDGYDVRIKSMFNHFATTVPEAIAKNYPPFEFDGTLGADVDYVVRYEIELAAEFDFDRVYAYENVSQGRFPIGFQKIK